jgi:peptidoglycan/LPS O-acetylase OafA/YrhL
MTQGRIPTLDGLRAVAISTVIAAHVTGRGFGRIGVMIFFALSGYLITTRLLEEYAKHGRISLRDFYLRRAFRILPPAVTYIAILSLLVALGIVACNGWDILGSLLFYSNYMDIGDEGWKVGHFWSLSVEEHFYLIWPALLVLFGVWKGWRTAAVLAVGMIGWRLIDNHFHIISRALNAPYLQEWQYRTDLIADTLLWGCCLAFVKVRSNAAVSLSVAAVAGVLLVLMIVGVQNRYLSYLIQNAHFIPAVFLWAILSCPTSTIGRFLELAPMRFIGALSYSLYIWQQFFFGGPGRHLPEVLGVAATFACAYLSYRLIEQPAIRLGKSVLSGKALVPSVG